MSYISALKKNNDVIVWERTSSGREMKIFTAPYYFYTKDPNGEYTSMYGDTLSRHDFATGVEFNKAKDKCKLEQIDIFEGDIAPELKLLSSKYHDAIPPTLNVTFFDIEVDYNTELGFSSVKNPYAPINSVALYNNWQQRMVVYAVPPADYQGDEEDLNPDTFFDKLTDISPFEDDVNVEFKFCKDERILLTYLLAEIEDSDVLTGWNSDFFDVPYVGKRMEMVLGVKYFNMLSFDGASPPRWREIDIIKDEKGVTLRSNTTLNIYGRCSVDYLALFKKFEQDEQPSYKLESVADVVIVDPNTKKPLMPKLEYEGSLATLYKKNFPRFVRYNLRDTEILKGFEDRLGYVETANQMYHMSTGLFNHVTGTIKLAELSMINYCHHDLDGIIVGGDSSFSEQSDDTSDKIQGALVLLPLSGMHDRIGSVDINSLYPSAIRSINISPETIIGQFVETGNEMNRQDISPSEIKSACKEIANNSNVELTFELDGTGEILTAPASNWRAYLLKNKYAVSGYGTVYSQERPGIIPSILSNWYSKRKDYQKLKDEAKAAGDKDKAIYYDKLQYVFKIKLNSFYGALSNKHFRFYDLRMGESTTSTGRMILTHQCAEICNILVGKYALMDIEKCEVKNIKGFEKVTWHSGYSEEYPVVYGDTDSSYFVTNADSDEDAIKIADRVGELCNESFPKFMRDRFLCSDGYDNIIKTGREIVADRGIFVDKKRYILHIIDNEGDTVDYIKVMGLDTKKTTLPKHISKKLNDFIGRLLTGEDWSTISIDIVDLKTNIKESSDFIKYGLPKGVNKMEQYQAALNDDSTTRLPGHVAAAILYNMCLKQYEDKESMPIYSGMKIKVFYLTSPLGRFKSIALPVDIEEVPSWFEENFVPIIDRKVQITKLIDNPLSNIIRVVDGIDVPSEQSLMLDDLFVY